MYAVYRDESRQAMKWRDEGGVGHEAWRTTETSQRHAQTQKQCQASLADIPVGPVGGGAGERCRTWVEKVYLRFSKADFSRIEPHEAAQ